MELLSAMERTRAHRSYADRDVATDDITFVVEYAGMAGSGHNRQPWTFIGVRDRSDIEDLAACGEYTTPLRRAPVGLVIAVDENESERRTEHNIFDCGRALQNLQLAARARGLGTVPQGISERERASELLNLPSSKRVFIALAVGYPSDEPETTIEGVPREEELDSLGRHDVDEILHWGTHE